MAQESAETSFNAGVAALQKGDATAAATEFRKSIALDADQPVALFNLGVAEQRLGRNGMALGVWRKALALSPEFEPAKNAISWTTRRLERADIASQPEFWESLRSAVLVQTSLLGFIVFLAVLVFAFGWTLLTYFGRRRRALLEETSLPNYPWIPTFFGTLTLIFALLTVAKSLDLEETRGTIIIKKIEARTAPDKNATPLFDLYEGLEVIVRNVSGDWAQVKFPGGSTGWIPREMLFTTAQQVGP
ncbi:MAG: SH3 domain-containing protein [Bdellovibrionota bacterium]